MKKIIICFLLLCLPAFAAAETKTIKIGLSINKTNPDKVDEAIKRKLETDLEYTEALKSYGYKFEVVNKYDNDYDIVINIGGNFEQMVFVSLFRVNNSDIDKFSSKLPKNLKNDVTARRLMHFNNVLLAYGIVPFSRPLEEMADYVLHATIFNIKQWLVDSSGQFVGQWQRTKRAGQQ